MRDDNLRDLEVLTIGSDPIDKTSETTDKEKAVDATRGAKQCSLVATMVTAEAAKEAEAKGVQKAVVAEQEAAAVAAEEVEAAAAASAVEDKRIRTKGKGKEKHRIRDVRNERKRKASEKTRKGDG